MKSRHKKEKPPGAGGKSKIISTTKVAKNTSIAIAGTKKKPKAKTDFLVRFLPRGSYTKRTGIEITEDMCRPLSEIIADIKNGTYEQAVGRVRTLVAKDKQTEEAEAKKNLPAFQVSLTTYGELNPLVVIDWEKKGSVPKSLLKHVRYSFPSASGRAGRLCLVVLIQQPKDASHFSRIASAIIKQHGIASSEGQTSYDRMRYVSMQTKEARVYDNPKAEAFTIEEDGEDILISGEALNNVSGLKLYKHLICTNKTKDEARQIMEGRQYDSESLATTDKREKYYDKWYKDVMAKVDSGELRIIVPRPNKNDVEDEADEIERKKLFVHLSKVKESLRHEAADIPEKLKWLRYAAQLMPKDPGLGMIAAITCRSFYFPGKRVEEIRPVCLQLMIVGPSGSDKDAAHTIFNTPLQEIQKEWNIDHKAAMKVYHGLTKEEQKEQKPPMPTIMKVGWDFSDAAIYSLVAKNRLVVESSDLNGFLSRNSEWQGLESFWLKAYDGKSFTILRKGGKDGGSITIDDPEIVGYGTCTPEKYSNWLSAVGGAESGLLGRFLVYTTDQQKFDPDHKPLDGTLLAKYLEEMKSSTDKEVHIKSLGSVSFTETLYSIGEARELSKRIYNRYIGEANYNKSGVASFMNRLRTGINKLAFVVGLKPTDALPTWFSLLIEILFIGQLIAWENILTEKETRVKKNLAVRPNALTVEEVDNFLNKVEGHRKSGLTNEQIAKKLGLTKSSFRSKLQRYKKKSK